MSQDTETSGLYDAILAVRAENAGEEVTFESIGLVAWERLSGAQRREALSDLLTVYATRVSEEESMRQLDRAAWDDTHTYLQEFDTAMLWDSASTPANRFEEVPANADALRNVLCELELLQHRLAMRDSDTSDQEGL
jgi:hypothetical protein